MIHTSYCNHSYWHCIKEISTDTNYKLYAMIKKKINFITDVIT